jgi:hypothetical protein
MPCMQARFSSREDGQIDVDLGPDWSLFNDALNDCVSSLPPRGANGRGPSTYWVDVARIGLARAVESHSDRPFTAGNITLLRLRGGQVEARYDYDDEDVPGQFLAVDEVQQILNDWRKRIEEKAAVSRSRLPETYRRNPATDHPV